MATKKENISQITKDDSTILDVTYPGMPSMDNGELEKFPSFLPSRKLSTKSKSKSLTEAEISGDMAGVQDLATVVERLRNEEPPLSLEQVRDRRASIKKQRKESISLIRSRTASRASNGGRPSMEAMENGKRIG